MFRMSDPKDTKYWNPAKYQCPECKDIIFSPRPGDYVSCSCDECFVDQTRHYSRIGGKAVLVEEGTYEEE